MNAITVTFLTPAARPDPRVGRAFALLATAMAPATEGYSPERQRAVADGVARASEVL